MRQGTLYIISAPSGAGKTSLSRALLEKEPRLVASVSTTTRPRREGEREGIDYHFSDLASFQTSLNKGEYLEHAEVFGNHYATTRSAVEQRMSDGYDVLLEIDWQGARQVRQKMEHSVSVFILPPSREELERRLRLRAQDSEETIQQRMELAQREISHHTEYDYLVMNDDFNNALSDLRAIIRAGHLSRDQQLRFHRELLDNLMQNPRSE